MFTKDHLSSMGDFFHGLVNVLELAPPEHLEAIALLLYEYGNQACHLQRHGHKGLPALMFEIGNLYGEAFESSDREPEEYRRMLMGDRGEHRRTLVELAACWAMKLTDEEVRIAFHELHEARLKFPKQAETEPKPVAVAKPARKRKAKAAKKAA